MKEKQKNKIIQDLIVLCVVLAIATALLIVFPNKRLIVLDTIWSYFIEMMLILPAVMIILGLFTVHVSKDLIIKYLGKTSGVKGIFLALLIGALPTGPLYIAFPMAATLLKKGARISNIIIFLSAWACIKVPQEMVELQFLGAKFMVLRLTLTVFFVIIVGLLIEKIVIWSEKGDRKWFS